MKLPVRAVLAPLAIALSYGSFALACPQWTQEMGLDVWNYFDEEHQLRAELQKQKDLQEGGDRVSQRLRIKILITEDLANGRITLAEATAQFHELNLLHPEIMAVTRQTFPADTDEESVVRQVISFVKARESDRSTGQALVTCLEEEYEMQKTSRAAEVH